MRLAATFAAAALLAAAAPAQSEEVVLKYATLNPPGSAVSREFNQPWVEKINEAGKGALKVEMFEGFALGNNLNIYDRVLADVAQMAWGIPVYFTGKFVLTNVTGLPFIGDNAEVHVDRVLASLRARASSAASIRRSSPSSPSACRSPASTWPPSR